MNIFYLDKDQRTCAEYHVDKHVVKMILEYSQLLSTAHRVLDGQEWEDTSSGRRIKRWKLQGEKEEFLYKATHVNHPSAIWVREGKENYRWLAGLLVELCKEYSYRYGKVHKCEYSGLVKMLEVAPTNIPFRLFSEPTVAMPEEFVVEGDSLESYREYYRKGKKELWGWRSRGVPGWIGGIDWLK